MMEEIRRDFLTGLPPELLHMIISYLFPTHEPDKAFHSSQGSLADDFSEHPLDRLAAASTSLRAQVMDWAESFVRQHRDINKYAFHKKTTKSLAAQNWLRNRGGLLWWAHRFCVFCGKGTTRTAIMMNGLNCCKVCDNIQWPGKITKSAAKEQYHLTDHHLLPHKYRTPISAKMLARYPGLPKLRYGTCMVSNMTTTMFMRKDVEALATLLHGDLRAHLAKRNADREERVRKGREMAEKRRAEWAHRLVRAPLQVPTIAPTSSNARSSIDQPIVIDSDDDDQAQDAFASFFDFDVSATGEISETAIYIP